MPGSQDPRILSSCFSPSSSHCLHSIYFFFFRCFSQTSSIPYFLVPGGEMHYKINYKGLLITERVKQDLLMLWKGHGFTGERVLVTFALRDIPAAALAVQVGAVPTEPEPCWVSGASLGSAGGAEPGQQHSFAPPGRERQAVLLPGAAGREGVVKQSGCYCCWKIKGSCKQSGRAFTFTLVFPVWSKPKRRTWKSTYGEGEMCIYSIKSRPYGTFVM